MSDAAKNLDEILSDARKLTEHEDTLLCGVREFDGVFFNYPAERAKRSRDNRTALVAEVERLRAALNHEAYVSELRARERDRAEARVQEIEDRIANALAT